MSRSVHQILGLLGAKDPSAIRVYPLPASTTAMVTAWADVWGADYGRMTAAISRSEGAALVAAGAVERSTRD